MAFSRSTAGERYVVSFVGALAGVDINPKGIGIASTQLDYALLTNGAPAVAEVQRLSLDRAADTQGTFVLSFSHAGQTYTSGSIAFGASAATVQTALRAATAGTATLGNLGTVSVTSGGADAYLVRFGGALTGANVAAVVVSAISVDAELPEGSREDGALRRALTASDSLETRLLLAQSLLLQGRWQDCMDLCLEIIGRDRKFREDAARKVMLAAFELCGDPPLVGTYRRRLSAGLY